jgi:hypothetical protein
MLLVHDQGSGRDAIGGEGGGGAGRPVGHDESKVGAPAGLEACLGGAEAEAERNEKLGNVAHVSEGNQPI